MLCIFILSPLAAEKPPSPLLSFSGGATLDVAPFGVEKKFATLQAHLLYPLRIAPGIKPQFAFNHDSWSLYLPVTLAYPVLLSRSEDLTLEPYGGGGAVYHSDSGKFHLLITGGINLRWRYFYMDLPVHCYFKEGDSDFLIGLSGGVSFPLSR